MVWENPDMGRSHDLLMLGVLIGRWYMARCVGCTCTPGPWEAEAEEALLVYIMNSRPAKATSQDPVSGS